MKPDIDTIVKDIVEHNPELALEASALRALVAELAAKQLEVTVDAAFRARLRAELLYDVQARKEAKRTALPWWLIYTVPVGVTVILLLVVKPSYLSTPAPTSPDAFDAAPATLEMEEGASKRSGEMSEESMSTGMAEDAALYQAPVGSSDFFTAAFNEDNTVVRFAYVSVSAPAFIQISGPEGEVLASTLIVPGEHTNLELLLPRAVTQGATYTATLYYDNGDGVFSAIDDTPAFDAAGMPISMTLVP